MKGNRNMKTIKLTLLTILGLSLALHARAETFIVSNTSDSGAGSLRQAILDANATGDFDQITFAILGGGTQTIQPASALPDITDPVLIDGYTQPGASANTLT